MVGAQELVLLTGGNGRRSHCGCTFKARSAAEDSAALAETRGSPTRTAVQFIRAVSAVVDAVTPLGHLQTHAIVATAESSGGRTLELP